MHRAVALLSVGLTAVGLPAAAIAQPDAPPAAIACDGRVVTAIEIRAEPPAVVGRTPPGWARPALRLLLQSPRTEESAVRPFLLLLEGDACTEFRRAESERLLRAQPYLAGARVTPVADGAGVRLVVETEDDVALIVGGGLRGGTLSRARYGNANVFGLGMLAAAEWERGGAYRDGWGGQYEHYHAFGGRQVVTLDAWRGPRDERYAAAIARPYLTDAQRIAWSVGYVRDETSVDFPTPGVEAPSLDFAREVYGASWIARLGGRRRAILGGLAFSHERAAPRGAPVFVTDAGLVAADAPRLAGAYRELDATRAGVVLGTRALVFGPLLVFDSLGGAQDVASGVQLLGTVGYEFGDEAIAGIASGRTDGREPFAAADLYAGLATSRSLTSFALLAGFGAAAFADLGKVWAGDVPYGTTTRGRAGAGAGLLVAVPRRSQRLYRLDVAAPLTRDRDARSVTVRVSRAFPFGEFGRAGGDLSRACAARPAAPLLPPP